ncbi:hypothetical protein [Parabacteroides sp. PF5-9]|uniref:hypothetical protein n=1 Tax=Parabacteroides sp. PF5-9 TaxID=1742404 RepID=UPI0024732062|nr:hypothetical protein [Parabacteroides sp. PF5-9]MDH6357032.1 hypothetical protein [Parabacteroides sp. PF5-9]
MKRYGVFMPIFKIDSALINCPVRGQSYIPKNSGWKDAPCGQNVFAFWQIARCVDCSKLRFLQHQPLALPEGIFLSEVGKN